MFGYLDITRRPKEVVNMMKCIVLAILLGLALTPAAFSATDWSDFESGRGSTRIDGYQGQPGYMAFTDGDGSVGGYIYWNDVADELYVVTAAAFDTTTALGDSTSATNVGVPLSEYSGSGSNP